MSLLGRCAATNHVAATRATATAGVQFYLGVHNVGAFSNSIVGVMMTIVSRDLAHHAIDAHNGALDREPLPYRRVQQNITQSCGDRVRDCTVGRHSERKQSGRQQENAGRKANQLP